MARELRNLAASEAPGIASELTGDDDRVRDWINRIDVAALGRQSETDVARMLNVLLSGVVTDDDMRAIEHSRIDRYGIASLRRGLQPCSDPYRQFGGCCGARSRSARLYARQRYRVPGGSVSSRHLRGAPLARTRVDPRRAAGGCTPHSTPPANENGERHVQSSELHMGMADHLVQRCARRWHAAPG